MELVRFGVSKELCNYSPKPSCKLRQRKKLRFGPSCIKERITIVKPHANPTPVNLFSLYISIFTTRKTPKKATETRKERKKEKNR